VDTRVTDFVNVRARAAELRLELKSELAILPRHFEDANDSAGLAHEAEASTLRKVLDDAGLAVQQLEPPTGRLAIVVEHTAEWVLPVLFVGSMLLTQNSYAIQVALSVLGSYAADFLKGVGATQEVKLTVVVERTRAGSCRRLDYQGPASRVKELEGLIRSIQDDRSAGSDPRSV